MQPFTRHHVAYCSQRVPDVFGGKGIAPKVTANYVLQAEKLEPRSLQQDVYILVILSKVT